MEDELLTDELPSPPEGQAVPEIDDVIDASLFGDVPKMGDAIPAGTYAFRLEKYEEGWSSTDYKTGRTLSDEEKQPYFSLQWKCQQEPHVGRVVFDIVTWVKTSDVKAANDPQNPRRGEARSILNKRLPKAKAIMEAAGFVPTGQFGFKQFLATNPELKLQLKLKEKQDKQPNGTWKGNGDYTNDVQKYLSLHRPA